MAGETARTQDRWAIAPADDGRPALLVDVDGVLSLWGWPGRQAPPGTWTNVQGLMHFLSAEAAQALRGLDGTFAPIWCTGWEERANEHLPHLVGLGPWPYLSFDRVMAGARSHGHWKLGAIDAALGPDRPLAWVDDDLDHRCEAWAAARPGPTLLVRTQPGVGLTRAHARVLEAWAATPGR